MGWGNRVNRDSYAFVTWGRAKEGVLPNARVHVYYKNARFTVGAIWQTLRWEMLGLLSRALSLSAAYTRR
jgi:hypothetical protein